MDRFSLLISVHMIFPAKFIRTAGYGLHNPLSRLGFVSFLPCNLGLLLSPN